MPQRTVELVTARTSADCISYRLYSVPAGITEAARLLWSNRVYDRPEGRAGARRRAQAWCLAHGYRIVERAGGCGSPPSGRNTPARSSLPPLVRTLERRRRAS
jgi:hypothetical protein